MAGVIAVTLALSVVAIQASRRRAGLTFGLEPVVIDPADITEQQFQLLISDPNLRVWVRHDDVAVDLLSLDQERFDEIVAQLAVQFHDPANPIDPNTKEGAGPSSTAADGATSTAGDDGKGGADSAQTAADTSATDAAAVAASETASRGADVADGASASAIEVEQQQVPPAAPVTTAPVPPAASGDTPQAKRQAKPKGRT